MTTIQNHSRELLLLMLIVKVTPNKQIESNLKATDPTAIAANAAAILSSVPSSVAQNVVVAPLISNQQNAMNDLSPTLRSNMEEFLSNAAATAQSQAPTQAQPQDSSGNKRAVSTRNLTNDERRQRRLLRNRVAAKECRRKKKAYVADLEEKVTRLEEENNRLNKEIDELNTKLSLNILKLEENARLHKEIEELKAKLHTTQQHNVQNEIESRSDMN
ncbi:hypothetical protein C1645_749399 [Glomus cerebriforme]|uniref:BZIP domain-containing protein n=1 Tax=Glomus cerebriforme TaxID=658196 RepID=A0A397TNZ5_9GLOM|nr:hypothetical protein C1645_749399 [Glomus cerebriforme]